MNLFFSTNLLPNSWPVTKAVKKFFQHDIRRIELGSNQTHDENSNNDFKSLNSLDLTFLIHNYFPPPKDPFVLNLASTDERLREKSITLCERAIDLSSHLKASFYSVHAGFRADLNPESLGKKLVYKELSPYKKAYGVLIDSVKRLLEYGKKKGVKLAIEPNVMAPFNLVEGRNEIALMCESWELLNFFQDIDDPNLGVLLDLGHLNVSARTLNFDQYEFIEKFKDKIFAFHIHHNNGLVDEHKPLPEDSWIFDIITRPEFQGLPIILEARRLTDDQILAQKKLIERKLGIEN